MSHSYGSYQSEVNPPNRPQRRQHRHGRHMNLNEDGELCITVIDPATCKLLVPLTHVLETRAQQRSTLPSLCQLYLQGRCRQGAQCYQVHAQQEMIAALRSRVEYLPCCCVQHGDKDRMGLLDHTPQTGYAPVRRLKDVLLYLPHGETGEASYVPLTSLSYTLAVRQLLQEQDPLHATGLPLHQGKVTLDGSGLTVCRLHAMDRCRYAEECKFLHLCKEITQRYPRLAMDADHEESAFAGIMGSLPSNPSSIPSLPVNGYHGGQLLIPAQPSDVVSNTSLTSRDENCSMGSYTQQEGKIVCARTGSYRYNPYSNILLY
ncbi:hypothetical protein AGDE_13574 [Angomonas deanei]|nr:hypothetical protein AGDE_13574 [Angomonas deanei]|eukprot:EPY22140.1 hypothetical protein AGDE_13574 [Angomonas deanei]